MYSIPSTRTLRHRRAWTGSAPKRVVGLISGTSADGIDTVIVDVHLRNGRFTAKQRAFATIPYPRGLRERILAHSLPGTGSVESVTQLNAVIGRCFARAVLRVARGARIPLSSIDLIGSHGQTVHHLPDRATLFGIDARSTLQIGDPSIIAQLTGIPTVGDFRTADMAAGGQGAPLVPFLDHHLFASRTKARILLNLGGIANITVLPKRCRPSDVIAFDTGPANMVIDALAQQLTGRAFDRNGRFARGGDVNARLLAWMMAHPFIALRPPKSTGREVFGATFIRELLRRGRGLGHADLLATATEFTAASVAANIRRFATIPGGIDEVIVSGGGAHNRFLMERLQAYLAPARVMTSEDLGASIDAKEAILFAVLAVATVLGIPGNIPRATGARRSVVLGKICIP